MSTLNFKTPIRQVTSSIYEHTPDKNLDTYNYCPSLMAVRTISGTTFLKVIVPELEDAQDYLKAVGERHEDYLKLFIKYDFKTIRTSQVEVDLSPKDLWKTCEYGSHPQTLLVASRISADLFDFRSRDVTLIYDTNNEDKIFSFQRSPVYNAFEFILTTQNNVMLLDQRFPKRPMLMWPHHHSSPPCGVNITKNEKISIVLTCLADMDVGTMPELRVKQSQNWHFEKIWDYISKDFKCISLNNISPFVLKTDNIGHPLTLYEILKNIPGSHINDLE
ncbi:unnamed protein product [Rhizophagus irregularis]|nr:unnamed protein product [Rhizophagus irregularis]